MNLTLDEPLRHIERPHLPWRESNRTVCGRPVSDYAMGLVISLDEARDLVRRLGQQRAAFVLCQTCTHRAGGWAAWDNDPVARMERECDRNNRDQRELIGHELRAIAILIGSHRDEFDALVEQFTSGDVVTMADLRRKRARR